MAEPESREACFFEALVSAKTGRPFVRMTCTLDGEPIFAMNMPPSVATAMGLRTVQAAIEAERDAALVAWVAAEMGPTIGVEGEVELKQLGGMMLSGLRKHREQFDAAAGSTSAPLSDDDPTALGDGPG